MFSSQHSSWLRIIFFHTPIRLIVIVTTPTKNDERSTQCPELTPDDALQSGVCGNRPLTIVCVRYRYKCTANFIARYFHMAALALDLTLGGFYTKSRKLVFRHYFRILQACEQNFIGFVLNFVTLSWNSQKMSKRHQIFFWCVDIYRYFTEPFNI